MRSALVSGERSQGYAVSEIPRLRCRGDGAGVLTAATLLATKVQGMRLGVEHQDEYQGREDDAYVVSVVSGVGDADTVPAVAFGVA